MTKSNIEKLVKPFSRECETGGLLMYIPSEGQFLSMSFGNGDNLSKEDEKDGYIDYIYSESYRYTDPYFGEGDLDCGMMMLTQEDVKNINTTSQRQYTTFCILYLV